jgi:hypothetical protein
MRLTVALACSALATIAVVGGWLSPDHATAGAPGVTISKTPDDATVQAGGTVSFTMSGQAFGTAGTFELTDQLPGDGLTWSVTGTPSGFLVCLPVSATNFLRCVGVVATSGDVVDYSVTVSAATDESDCGILENTAQIDFTVFSNSDTGSITIECPPEIPGPPDIDPIVLPPLPSDVDLPEPEQPFVVQPETAAQPDDDGVGPKVGTGDSWSGNASRVSALEIALVGIASSLTATALWLSRRRIRD